MAGHCALPLLEMEHYMQSVLNQTQSRRRLAIALVFAAGIALLCAMSVSRIYAYLTYAEEKVNVLEVGYNEISIREEFSPPPSLTQGRNDTVKQVRIENTGSVPCYTRVFMDFSDNAAADCSVLSADGSTYYELADFRQHLNEGWTYVESTGPTDPIGGYYYYTEPLQPGEETTKLLSALQTTFADLRDVIPFNVYIYAESVQLPDENADEISGTGVEHVMNVWTEYLNAR